MAEVLLPVADSALRPFTAVLWVSVFFPVSTGGSTPSVPERKNCGGGGGATHQEWARHVLDAARLRERESAAFYYPLTRGARRGIRPAPLLRDGCERKINASTLGGE